MRLSISFYPVSDFLMDLFVLPENPYNDLIGENSGLTRSLRVVVWTESLGRDLLLDRSSTASDAFSIVAVNGRGFDTQIRALHKIRFHRAGSFLGKELAWLTPVAMG